MVAAVKIQDGGETVWGYLSISPDGKELLFNFPCPCQKIGLDREQVEWLIKGLEIGIKRLKETAT